MAAEVMAQTRQVKAVECASTRGGIAYGDGGVDCDRRRGGEPCRGGCDVIVEETWCQGQGHGACVCGDGDGGVGGTWTQGG